MSRIGKLPITLPDGVSVVVEGNTITIKGVKGELTKKFPKNIEVKIEDSATVKVIAKKEDKQTKALHGTYRAIIANMVKGVTDGWSKTLELVGAGYRAEVAGDTLTLLVGYSHPVKIKAPSGITLSVQKTDITIDGIDREIVGLIAAKIRDVRPPEPYKGKGIRYKDEVVKIKPGKAAKAQGAAAA